MQNIYNYKGNGPLLLIGSFCWFQNFLWNLLLLLIWVRVGEWGVPSALNNFCCPYLVENDCKCLVYLLKHQEAICSLAQLRSIMHWIHQPYLIGIAAMSSSEQVGIAILFECSSIISFAFLHWISHFKIWYDELVCHRQPQGLHLYPHFWRNVFGAVLVIMT